MKYIIDIPEDAKYGILTCKVDRGYYTKDIDLEKTEQLNSDYINENYGELQDEAYKRGKKDGEKEEHERMIALFSKPFDNPNAFSWKELWDLARITKNLEKQKEINVGDEVRSLDDEGTVMDDLKPWIVTCEYVGYYQGVDRTGEIHSNPKELVIKTGRHFDIETVLEAMRNDR